MEWLEGRELLSGGVLPDYRVIQDWGSGFQAEMSLANQDPRGIANWTLEFDFASRITDIWDARVVGHAGTHYTLTGVGWNNDLAGGGAVTFGFIAAPGHPTAAPANLLLNGAPLSGSTAPPPPPPPVLPVVSVGDATVAEGTGGTATASFSVSLSQASAGPVTVRYSTADDTARAGSDYQAASGLITFAPGQTQQSLVVTVLGDTIAEPSEAFAVNLESPAGAALGKARGAGTILDTAPPPTGQFQFQFQVVSDWGSGFTGQITVANPGPSAIHSWALSFDFAGQVGAIWNATVVGRNGNRHVVSGADWNRSIPAGGSVTFGFNASPGGTPPAPTNYRLSDGTTPAEPPGPNRAPTAGDDSAQAFASLPVSISVLANDSDPDADTLTVASVTQGRGGSVVANSNGTVTYSPNPGFTGDDAFTYAVSDGRGGTATATVSVSVLAQASSAWPERVYAPYVDMGLYPTYDLAEAARTHGVRYFTLAFIVADPSGRPSWGGYSEYAVDGGAFDMGVRRQLAAVRALGGDAMVSFGGAANRELAEVIADPAALVGAYRTVIDAYNLTHVDFDIEGAAAADRVSVDRRSQAIATLQREAAAAGRTLSVAFTLPVLPTGLTPDGLYILQSAVNHGVRIDGVNIMTMDYGDSAAPNPQGRMGDYTIAAAESLFTQLRGLYGTTRTDAQLWAAIGLTPMIGVNDVTTEVFDLPAAQQVADFAARRGIGRISIWSLNRDRSSPRGALTHVELTSSSIVQQPFEFSRIFGGYQS